MSEQRPEKQNYKKELLMTAFFLMVMGVIVAILAKLFVGLIILLLGVIAGIGSRAGNLTNNE